MTQSDLPFPSSVHPHETNGEFPLGYKASALPLPKPVDDPRTLHPSQRPNWRVDGNWDLRVGPSDRLHSTSSSFRHSGWAPTRRRLLQAFHRTLQTDNRVARFVDCGSQVRVFRSTRDKDRFKLVGNYCRDRFCTPCARAKAWKLAQNLADFTTGRDVRFITLTLKSHTEDLPSLIGHLYASFRRLRTSWSWKRYVDGSAAFLEIKYCPELRRWHPHLHILAEGRYYPHRYLKAAWYHATKGSFICDIRPAGHRGERVAYVTKYAGKAISSHILSDPDRLDLALTALHGRRVCLTTGSWRGVPLLRTLTDEPWLFVDDLDNLIYQRNNGHRQSADILSALSRSVGLAGLVDYVTNSADLPFEPG